MDSSLIFILAVIILLIVFGIVSCNLKSIEGFSPMGFTQNCPNGKGMLSPRMAYGRKFGHIRRDGSVYGSNSPGSVFKCDNVRGCPNLNIKGCAKKMDIPIVRENLPLGWGTTMTGPYADNNCLSGINGVNKASMENPYGRVYPEGDQMYGFCEKGIDNFFSN